MPVAKKPYECFLCGAPIEKGEYYVSVTVQTVERVSTEDGYKDEKGLATIKVCNDCFYDDDFEERILGSYLSDYHNDNRRVFSIVKAR